VAVVGPTATGKSELGLALAEALGGEVVNADAMQLYRGMDVGTAKLAVAERRGVVHHQLDVLDVGEEASVAAYQRHARADLEAIEARGRTGVVVGGSGLYVRALLDRMELAPTDAALRARLEVRAAEHGPGLLHDELARLDPVAAEAIARTNTRRIVRALEVIELTGRPLRAALPEQEYVVPTVQVGLDCARAVLDARIESRVDRMWSAGLVAEVGGLADRMGRTAERAVGYAQVLAMLRGETDEATAREATVVATRRLARRQMTWFGRDPRVHWLDATDPDLVARAIDAVDAARDGRLPEPGRERRTLGS
jgi:tRNA dimethylallyltransferase